MAGNIEYYETNKRIAVGLAYSNLFCYFSGLPVLVMQIVKNPENVDILNKKTPAF